MAGHPLHPPYPDDLAGQDFMRVGLPVQVGEVCDDGVRNLLLGFESLGEDCEFGLVQRRYAAEPLSLLRWMTTPPAALLQLLDCRFADFADEVGLEIRVAPWGELMAYDTRYGTKMHTFVHASGIDRDLFAHNHRRRVAFLMRKLIEDLAAQQKIFVVQAGPDMSGHLARQIASALRRYGSNVVLAVGLADADHPGGTVEARGDGLLWGALDRRGKTAAAGGGHSWNIDFDAWVSLCRQSAGLVAEGYGR